MRAAETKSRTRNESKGRSRIVLGEIRWPRAAGASPARLSLDADEAEHEHIRSDPKDGELCLNRTKSEETLMEVRSDSDVQIDRQI